MITVYKCKCGKEYENKQSYVAHCGHCKIHLGREPTDRFRDSRAWMKGKTTEDPIYGDSILKFAKSGSHNKGESVIIHDRSKFKRQSETRIRRYLSGELTPAQGVGRGKYSFLSYKNKVIMLRSTYEFIFALYLLYKDIDFEYESVRVPTITDYKKSKSFVSDFKIGNHIIEIKGVKSSKVVHAKAAFEAAGYTYEVKYWNDLIPYYEFLKSKMYLDSILDLIKQGHNSGEYFFLEFNYF